MSEILSHSAQLLQLTARARLGALQLQDEPTNESLAGALEVTMRELNGLRHRHGLAPLQADSLVSMESAASWLPAHGLATNILGHLDLPESLL